MSPPPIDPSPNYRYNQEQSSRDQGHGHPQGRLRNALFDFLSLFLRLLVGVGVVRQIVLRQKRFLIEPEVVGNRANESAVEDPAGKPVPFLVFERFQKTGSDARGLGDFLQRNLAQFPLAF